MAECNYWADCRRPAFVKISYNIKKWNNTESHVHYLCEICQRDIRDNLPGNAFDFNEEPLMVSMNK